MQSAISIAAVPGFNASAVAEASFAALQAVQPLPAPFTYIINSPKVDRNICGDGICTPSEASDLWSACEADCHQLQGCDLRYSGRGLARYGLLHNLTVDLRTKFDTRQSLQWEEREILQRLLGLDGYGVCCGWSWHFAGVRLLIVSALMATMHVGQLHAALLQLALLALCVLLQRASSSLAAA